ncbi:hypothetical protein [Streptomyces sp. NPDC046371]
MTRDAVLDPRTARARARGGATGAPGRMLVTDVRDAEYRVGA